MLIITGGIAVVIVKITQTDLAEKLGMKKSLLSKVLSGQSRIRREQARLLEAKTGISEMVFRDGEPTEIIAALEKVFGVINFTKGRPRKSNI